MALGVTVAHDQRQQLLDCCLHYFPYPNPYKVLNLVLYQVSLVILENDDMGAKPDPKRRHFRHDHPLFKEKKTEQGVWWEDSYYFLWYRCLVRHEGYQRFCKTGRGKQYQNLHADFGDITSDHGFKDWWRDNAKGLTRGVYLFAEPSVVRPHIIDPKTETIRDDDDIIYLALPANKPENYLLTEASKLLKKAIQRQERDPATTSYARYPLYSSPQAAKTYKAFLDIWDLRQQGLPSGVIYDRVYGKPDWDDYAKRWMKRHELNETDTIQSQRQHINRSLQVSKGSQIKRNYDKACALIKNAAKGIFPKAS